MFNVIVKSFEHFKQKAFHLHCIEVEAEISEADERLDTTRGTLSEKYVFMKFA